ncbi:hypothetical protein V5P93_001967 [Actinokineospora auranticolor]|uniref:Uncharacterized protein n=1 Tax=Actinokineospora auranticolor TaxID=155976 RepID=A0A2S6GEN1_9PSEU|nr:hypothetical protein [Actinokineospora auranticolor]PPK63611.1 hypothetical protein CLV40_12618 [Actinokineospora auranticolor]
MARYYQPWPTPVQAAHYTEPGTLPAIGQWVTSLRQQGRVAPQVSFTIDGGEPPVGVLTNGAVHHALVQTEFLVYDREGLHVLDAHTFWRHYYDPFPPDREWTQ